MKLASWLELVAFTISTLVPIHQSRRVLLCNGQSQGLILLLVSCTMSSSSTENLCMVTALGVHSYSQLYSFVAIQCML